MRCLLALVVIATLGAPLEASAADAPTPLRELVYDVTYSAHTTHETKSSGFNGAYGGGQNGVSGAPSGEGSESHMMDGSDHGTLTLDIVAAPPDGGLVVDASFTGGATVQPVTRVAVFADGRLSADPNHPLCPEAVRVLPLIARGFIANRDVSPGASWTTQNGPPAQGSTTYRVSKLDGQQATIGIDGSFSAAGGQESDRGTTVYATDVVSPVSLDLTSTTRRQLSIDTTQTTVAHVTALLVHDSFPRK
jgi:hypothetical protein